ncbi:Cytochrome P450 monooxygenase [Rhizoctonia solani]|uniref:Cytochrome P450 monooxygenase n=1 Tax=Rhizoctonia solani TaxID=456999 RepID=A0A8H7I9K9_9AGAM|nr:Cytochrome P450 monooxygenase [Rhizoctonia solani]
MFTETTQHSNAHYYAAAGVLLTAYYVVPYLLDPHDYRRRFSGPWLASLSGSWLARSASSGRHYQNILQLHEKYGKFVRVGPNHISISDPDALEEVYGHSSGLLKSEFYDAFARSARDRNLFDVRDKTMHTIKRKRIANIYSAQNVTAFEPRRPSRILLGLIGRLKMVVQSLTAVRSFSYLAFDLISDLALGVPFGMVEAQKDSVPDLLALSSETNFRDIAPVRIMADVATNAMTLGSYGTWIQNLLFWAPWSLSTRMTTVNLIKIIQTTLDARTKVEKDRAEANKQVVDLLDKLFEVKNADGSPLASLEIEAEATITLTAGERYDLQKKLQQELDLIEVDSAGANGLEDQLNRIIPSFEQVKNLPYLTACVKETLRLYSTVGSGLPRVVPEGKTVTFAGQTFNAGSVVSVPSYCTNKSSVWGPDPDTYRPERWLEEGASSLNKYFAAFSTGPR